MHIFLILLQEQNLATTENAMLQIQKAILIIWFLSVATFPQNKRYYDKKINIWVLDRWISFKTLASMKTYLRWEKTFILSNFHIRNVHLDIVKGLFVHQLMH
jgi:hypothetical protein